MPTLFTMLLVAQLGTIAVAQDWSQWRGPSRDGSVGASVLPAAWPASVTRVWRAEVGEGYSSPVIAGGRVFAHGRRDPEEIVTAVDLQTGKVIWQQRYPAPFAKNQYAIRMAKGPNSTPIVVGDRVITLGVTGVLSAWSVADGALAWRNDYSNSVDTSKLFCGTAMSPMLEDGGLIVQVGSDVHGGRVISIDPATGAARWTWKGVGPGYASPIAFTLAGTRHLVTLTNESILGLDARTGRALWSAPFVDEWHENIVTPLWTGTHVIVSGVRQGTQAYRLAPSGDKWELTPAWKNADVTMYMSAPVFGDDTIYGISNKRKGQFVALNAATGALRWATEGREGDHASILLTSSHVLLMTNGGDLVVARRDATKFVQDRRIELAESETWAVPAFVEGGVIIRDAQGVVRLAWGS